MTAPEEDFELRRIHLAHVQLHDGGERTAFVIDGRDYEDVTEMKRDLEEAWEAMRRLRIATEWETRPAQGDPITWVPTWRQYRALLPANATE